MKSRNGITPKINADERNVPSDGQTQREVDNLFLFLLQTTKGENQ